MLPQARTLEAPHAAIQLIPYLGDTRMNDGTAFTNICRSGGWQGMAFIASRRGDPNPAQDVEYENVVLYLQNIGEQSFRSTNILADKTSLSKNARPSLSI